MPMFQKVTCHVTSRITSCTMSRVTSCVMSCVTSRSLRLNRHPTCLCSVKSLVTRHIMSRHTSCHASWRASCHAHYDWIDTPHAYVPESHASRHVTHHVTHHVTRHVTRHVMRHVISWVSVVRRSKSLNKHQGWKSSRLCLYITQ